MRQDLERFTSITSPAVLLALVMFVAVGTLFSARARAQGQAGGILITRMPDTTGIADTDGEVGAARQVKIDHTIWAGFAGPCATGAAGHAVALYDRLADRWVISQFASATGGNPVTDECFAVSETSDATGPYYRYVFHLGGHFIDSPHLSIRPDGYLMGDSVYNEAGTERLGSQYFLFDREAMLTGAAATFTTPGLDAGVGETYSISAHGVRLASARGLDVVPQVSTLTINLTYDSDATFTGAGLTAQNITDMKAANVFAAAQFTNKYSDPINVNIRVTAVPGTGTLGQSNSALIGSNFTYAQVRTALINDQTAHPSADGATSTSTANLPIADPYGGSTFLMARALGKSLAQIADDLTNDGIFTFGGGFSYTYDPNNRAVAGKIDYIGVAMRELSEVMGRAARLHSTADGNRPFDVFRFTAPGTHSTNFPDANVYFSFDGGATNLKNFNANGNSGDLGDWAGGATDAFNASSTSGVKNDLTAVDLQVMDVLGYDLVVTSGLLVSPATNMGSSGRPGGPFTPTSFSYALSASSSSVGFTVSGTPSWLNASPTSGTTPATVTFTVNTNAYAFGAGIYPTPITFINSTNGQGSTTRTATLTVNAPSAPGNDHFANATTINTGQTLTGTNVNATAEGGKPNPAGVSGSHSVWWKWTAVGSGAATIGTCNSNYDTTLGVYTGSAVNALTPVAQNDEACSSQSQVSFTATAGTTYYIDVNGYSSASPSFGAMGGVAIAVSCACVLSAPTNVIANAGGSTTVNLSWAAAPGAASYRVYRSADHVSYTLVGSPTGTSYSDASASADTAYLYKVRSFDASESGDSNIDLATTVVFTDPTLTETTTTVNLAHFTELLTAINAVRTLAGVSAIAFTSPAPTTSVTIRRQHVLDLRSGLDLARSTLGLSALSYADSTITATTTTIKADHIRDLRNGVK